MKERQFVPLSPLTFVVGGNGVGKSSFLRFADVALNIPLIESGVIVAQYLREKFGQQEDLEGLQIGRSVTIRSDNSEVAADIGCFYTVREGSVLTTLSYNGASLLTLGRQIGETDEAGGRKIKGNIIEVDSINMIALHNLLVQISKSDNAAMNTQSFEEWQIGDLIELAGGDRDQVIGKLNHAISGSWYELSLSVDRLVRYESDEDDQLYLSQHPRLVIDAEWAHSKSIGGTPLMSSEEVMSILLRLMKSLEYVLDNLIHWGFLLRDLPHGTFVPALRYRSSAILDLAADQGPDWRSQGGLTYLELRDNPSLIESVNECLSAAGVDAHLSRVHLVDSDHYLDSLKMITQSDMAMSSIEGVLNRYEVYLYDGGSLQPIPMSQTGAGVSQMIPVIVALSGKRLALVEQPELHLHPRAVRAIADYLVNSTANAQASINVIETHSTDLVFRVLDHAQKERSDNAENGPDLGRSNVSVVFFERDGRSTRIRPTTLDKNGMVTEPWPVDFI